MQEVSLTEWRCCCVGTLDVMDIFNGRDSFKMHVQEKVEKVRPPCQALLKEIPSRE